MPTPTCKPVILNVQHHAAVKAAWQSIQHPNGPQEFEGELSSIGALDYFWYEGLTSRLPDDLWQSVASVWAAVVVRNLRFQPHSLFLAPGLELLVLSHEGLWMTLLPWARVYEAVESRVPQFDRLERAYLEVVVEMMDCPLSVDYPIHPVADILWLCPERYPPKVVDLVKAVHSKHGNRMVLNLGLEAYTWGAAGYQWPTVQRLLEEMLTWPT